METAAELQSPGTTSAIGSKLHSVQALRAIAALLVVWAHSIDAAKFGGAPLQAQFFHLENFGACGLDIFFIISGFIMAQVVRREESRSSGKAARHFLGRRVTRIFPLYWILTLVVVMEQQFGRYKVPWHRVNWVPTLFLLPSVPSMHDPTNAPLLWLGWSLMFEMYFYLVLTGFLAWRPGVAIRGASIFLCAMVAAGALMGFQRPFLVVWMNPMVLEFVFGCIAGILFSSVLPLSSGRIPKILSAIGAVWLALSIFTGYGRASEASAILTGHDCWLRVVVWGVPAALMVAGVIFWNPAMQSLPARVLVFLGDASYSIYLCTIPARSFVEHFWGVFGRFGADAGVFFSILFCTAAGIICYLLLERPLMRFFHNWYKPIPFRKAVTASAGA